MVRLSPFLISLLIACNTTQDTVDTGPVDATGPAIPTILSAAPAAKANENHPLLSGDAQAHVDVTLYADADCTTALGSANTGVFDTFTVEITVEDNSINTLYADATDENGKRSRCSFDPFVYIEDSALPEVPALVDTVPISPADANLPLVRGTGESETVIHVYSDSACTELLDSTLCVDGAWELRVYLADNTTTALYANAEDDAGNLSGCSRDSVSYEEDSQDPAVPTLTGTDPRSPSSSPTLALLGTTDPFAAVSVYTDAACTALIGEGEADDAGAFAVAVTVPSDQTTALYARAIDLADNVSPCAGPLPYRHDSLAPAAPILSRTEPASPSPENEPELMGYAEPGATVNLYSDACASLLDSATADSDGAFTFELSVADGSASSFQADATDEAGNTSSCSAPLTYTDSGAWEALTVIWLRPDDRPARVETGDTLPIDLKLGIPAGSTPEVSWELVDGEGALDDPSLEDPTYTAPSSPGQALLRVTVADGIDTLVRELLVSVEPPMGTWWDLATELSDVDPDRIDLGVSPYRTPVVLNLDATMGYNVLDGIEVMDSFQHRLGDRPMGEVYYQADKSAVSLAMAPDGTPWVAYSHTEVPTEPEEVARVMRWDGEGWVLEAEFPEYPLVRSLQLTFDGDEPWLALQTEASVAVVTRSGGVWYQAGDLIPGKDDHHTPHEVRIGVQSGEAVVAFQSENTLLNSSGAAWHLPWGASEWAELGELDTSLYGVSDVGFNSRGQVFVSLLDERAPLRTPKVVMWDGARWIDYGFLYVYATEEVDNSGQVRMTIDEDDHLYAVVGTSVYRSEADRSWTQLGGQRFGPIDFFSYQMSDVGLIEQGGSRLVYVAYPQDVGGGVGHTAVAAIRVE
ncbi:MAG: hypothetical protein JXX28_10030 [Deltaproteobacteria bacterium]|nr:hypothetical protein [Deltaproteobacteria bacterium]